MPGNCTVICVNFKTEFLTKTAVTSFRSFYPDMPFVLIDNGSQDESAKWCRQYADKNGLVFVAHDTNIGHGPALHKSILDIDTHYVFTLDSDTETKNGGFIDKMLARFENEPLLYALGWLRFVNFDGVAASGQFDKSKYTRYIHPYAAMYDREKYLELEPFVYHGAPCRNNMQSAKKKGYKVDSFPIETYIEHIKAGTRRMYEGRWNPKQDEKPREWRKDRNYPI